MRARSLLPTSAASALVLLAASCGGGGGGGVDGPGTPRPEGVSGITWAGYKPDSMRLGDDPPRPSPITNLPQRAVVRYTSKTGTICDVNQAGAPIPRSEGTCKIEATVLSKAGAGGVVLKTLAAVLTIRPAPATPPTWEGYDDGSMRIGDAYPPLPFPIMNLPQGADVSYATKTPDICGVDRDGVPEPTERELAGTCRIEATVRSSEGSLLKRIQAVLEILLSDDDPKWNGYSPKTFRIGESDGLPAFPEGCSHWPCLIPPTNIEADATLAYTSETPAVCGVSSDGRRISPVKNGPCRIKLTVTKDGASKERETIVTIIEGMIDLAWTNPINGNVPTGTTGKRIENLPTVSPAATLAYTSRTATVCTLGANRALTFPNTGTCTLRATATKTGYTSTSVDASFTVTAASTVTTTWTGYSSSSVTFPAKPTARTPVRGNADSGPANRIFASPGTTEVCVSGSPTTAAICTLKTGTATGEIDKVKTSGTCSVSLTAKKSGTADKTITRHFTVNPASMPAPTWGDYAALDGYDKFEGPPGSIFSLSEAHAAHDDVTSDACSPTHEVVERWTTVFDHDDNSGTDPEPVCSITESGTHPALGRVTFLAGATFGATCWVKAAIKANGRSDAMRFWRFRVVKPKMPRMTWTNPYGSRVVTAGSRTVRRETEPAPVESVEGITFRYQSDNPAVCDIDPQSGDVLARKQGRCEITAVARAPGRQDGRIYTSLRVVPPAAD